MPRPALLILCCAVLVGTAAGVQLVVGPAPAERKGEAPSAPPPAADTDRGVPAVGTGDGIVVPVYPGDDLQALVDAYPEGTRFHLVAGVHREVQVIPRDGQIFTGSGKRTVVSGARVLDPDDFVEAEGAWYVDGQTQGGEAPGDMLAGFERDAHPEDVFVDGDRRLRHVGSVDELDGDAFYFDYDADRIWLGADPGSFTSIETSVAPWAFAGTGVRDVVIADMVVEKYASPFQYGAIGGDAATRFTRDWQLVDLEVRYNHAGGILVGPGATVSGVWAHHNGQHGIAGNGSNLYNQGDQPFWEGHVTVEDSEISHNLQLGYDWQVEGGGTKFSLMTAGLTLRGNHVHDNGGPGLWVDIYNEDVLIADNVVEDNAAVGIFYEISFGDTTIRGNVVRGNGLVEDWPGILVSGSRGVVVRDNLVEGNGGGIRVLHDGNRFRLAEEEYELGIPTRDVVVRDNLVALGRGRHGFAVIEDESRWYDEVVFSGNAYVLSGDDVVWEWQDVDDVEGFLAAHPDDGPVLDRHPSAVPGVDPQPIQERTVGPS